MKSALPKPSHITRGNIFADLGFSTAESLELRIKSDLLIALRRRITASGYTQRELCRILDEHQPQISNLLNGHIAKMSIEKLLRYAGALGLDATVKVRSASTPTRPTRGSGKNLAA